MLEPIFDTPFVSKVLQGGVLGFDIETGGLKPWKHAPMTGGLAYWQPGMMEPATREYLLATQAGEMFLPVGNVYDAASQIKFERELMRPGGTTFKTIPMEKALGQASTWSKKHISPQVEAAVAEGMQRMTPKALMNQFFGDVRGRIGVVQNINYESMWMAPYMNLNEFTRTGRSSVGASRRAIGLRGMRGRMTLEMVPSSVRNLTSKAMRSQNALDWWKIFKGEGGIRAALMERGSSTMIIDLSSVTRSMFGGLTEHGLMETNYFGVHAGTNVNFLELAWHGTREAAEAHRAASDAKVEIDILRRHLNISEKIRTAETQNIAPSQLFTPREWKYVQRLRAGQQQQKLWSMEKSFAEAALNVKTGRGHVITWDVIPDFEVPVFEKGGQYAEEVLSGVRRRVSSKELANVANTAAARQAFEKQIVFQALTRHTHQSIMPEARAIFEKTWKMDQEALQGIINLERSADDIIASFTSKGALEVNMAGFTDDAVKAANWAKNKFRGGLQKIPTPWKIAGVAAIGLAALGATLGGTSEQDIQRVHRVPSYPYTAIEGLRRQNSMYSTVRGIYTSSMPWSNVSDFRSGVDKQQSQIRGAWTMHQYRKGELDPPAISFPIVPKEKPNRGVGTVIDRYQKPMDRTMPPVLPATKGMAQQKILEATAHVGSFGGHRHTPKLPQRPLEEPNWEDLQGLEAMRQQAQIATRGKMAARQAPGKVIMDRSFRAGRYGEIYKQGTTSLKAVSEQSLKVVRKKPKRNLAVKTGHDLDYLMYTPALSKIGIHAQYAERTGNTVAEAANEMKVGVSQPNVKLSAPEIYGKIAEYGPGAGRPDTKGLEFHWNKKNQYYDQQLSAVRNNRHDVMKVRPSDEMHDRFEQGKAGLIMDRSQCIKHKCGDQHARGDVTGMYRSQIRGRHPVKSRSMRSVT